MEKIEKDNPLSQSADIVKQNIDVLKQLFPTIVKEGKINIDELKALLDEEIETSDEYYRFTWAGKNEARREANKPSTATLRPDKADSKNWDTTGNIFIEGDNLEVLKLLQKSYAGKIKMMYFDPPYNTGKDFVYKDKYADNLSNYLSLTGQTDEEGNKITTNTESDGRYHSNWLNMMYPRLKLARNLLASDGTIFISIDDNEVYNLRKLCDEIFGEENYRNLIVIRRGAKSVQNQFDTIDRLNYGIEYILVYTKNSNFRFDQFQIELEEGKEGAWNNHWRGTDRPTMRYEIFGIKPESGQWRWSKDRSLKAIENYIQLLLETNCTSSNVSQEIIDNWWQKKYDEDEDELDLLRLSSNNKPEHYIPPSNSKSANSLWADLKPNGNNQLKSLFKRKVFDTPKSIDLITRLMKFSFGNQKSGLILDIFAGSGSTAHSVFFQNSLDAGTRRFICVQLPEVTDEKSDAFKAGYKNIADLCKERIRKAGEKVKSELNTDLFSSNSEKLDIGFKAFKLDSSNILAWDGSIVNFERNLLNAETNIKEGRTEEDVLFEILLKYGLDLTVSIEEKEVNTCKIYSIGKGVLFICLSDNITTEVATAIGKWKEELQPATCRALFKDNGFKDDIAKTNSIQILRQYGIEETNSI